MGISSYPIFKKGDLLQMKPQKMITALGDYTIALAEKHKADGTLDKSFNMDAFKTSIKEIMEV